MNAEVAYLYRERKTDEQKLGEQAYQLHALQHLKLKTVVKESHCSPAHCVTFNLEDPKCSNLFATVGGDQATIYDDMHMGDYIAVILSYIHQKSEHVKGGDLQACTWLNAEGWSDHPQGDTYLAVAGSSGEIYVISIVEAQVAYLLKGHASAVVELASCPALPGVLASLSRDGSVQLWDVPNERCLAVFAAEATALALHPDGKLLVTGTRKGAVHSWQLPNSTRELGDTIAAAPVAKQSLRESERVEFEGGQRHMEALDCMRFLPKNRLATKSTDGRMIVWNMTTRTQISSWKVPSCNAKGGSKETSKFGVTSTGDYICAGNSVGDVRVYDTSSGKQVALVSPIKISAPVQACTMSEDCRHLLAAIGNGYIFRYEYRKPTSQDSGAEGDGPVVENGSK